MIEEIELQVIINEAQKECGPSVSWQFAAYNWCTREFENGRRFIVYKDGKKYWDYTGGEAFNDTRPPTDS